MRLQTKWLLTSACGGTLAAAAIFCASDPFIFSVAEEAPVSDRILHAVFWPVTVCLHISGPVRCSVAIPKADYIMRQHPFSLSPRQ